MREQHVLELVLRDGGLGFPLDNFHGVDAPKEVIQREKGVHRLMEYMYASGKSLRDIAAETGYSEAQVSKISRQTWFRANVAQLIHSQGAGNIQSLIEGGAVEAAMVLRDLATSGETEAVRLKASQDILDRVMGKATQKVLHGKVNVPVDALDEIKQLEEKLKQ